jgi:putative colanic acid biosynthesis glycosyltransferase
MAAEAPFFSIVTVTFRNLKGLRSTAESVREQADGNWEWIVVDGGSTDGTCEYLAAVDDNRLRFVSEPDRGIFDGMRKGLADACGRYVVFMNAGDRFANAQTLSHVAAAIGTANPDLVYGDSLEGNAQVQHLKPARPPAQNRYVMFTHHQAQFYRTSVAREIGFDLSYRLSGDWVLTTRMLRRLGAMTLYVPEPLCLFERGGVSQQPAQRRTMHRELFRIYRYEHHHGLPRAAIYWLAKVGVNHARALLPGLYDRLRYQR